MELRLPSSIFFLGYTLERPAILLDINKLARFSIALCPTSGFRIL